MTTDDLGPQKRSGLLVGAVFFGWVALLQPIAMVGSGGTKLAMSTDRAGLLCLAGLMAIKWAIGLVFLR